MHNEVDVYIVQKQTTWERYTQRPLNVDFFDYLERDGQTHQPLRFAHEEHIKSRKLLIDSLEKYQLSYKIYNLDEVAQNNICFFNEKCDQSGLRPQKKLVISLGGDGTLLHASHHVGADIKLLGINSCPEHSVGHLCPIIPKYIEKAIECFVKNDYKTKAIRRLKLETSHRQNLPLALNDILLCNRHPAATSRYQVSVCSENGLKEIESEKQLSSGLWVASAAGSTAAISAYGFKKSEITAKDIHVAVREPYNPRHEVLKMKKFSLNGDKNSLSFFSRMRQGLVCVDGPDFCTHLGFGDSVHISLPEECELQLILDFLGKVPTFSFDK
ncbi:NAD(+)/NADH kinase [Fluviispira sanaruensis]|uniref:NAD(+) kinase n=1 Tax=Fluviispira sanaruensis TaxID=2493639 RepID=A0A4P2VVL4_FLUSA|nr:NAD(+)/NADH kinase [Fluviispira sanaruensis]BBH53585.1 hypothetical protein JCM31447_20290 [Fluviispira sanaruensis]